MNLAQVERLARLLKRNGDRMARAQDDGRFFHLHARNVRLWGMASRGRASAAVSAVLRGDLVDARAVLWVSPNGRARRMPKRGA